MPTTIGKKLRSRKVQLACERRQNQYADNDQDLSKKQVLLPVNDPNYSNLQTLEEQKQDNYHLLPQSNSAADLKRESKKGSGKGNGLDSGEINLVLRFDCLCVCFRF